MRRLVFVDLDDTLFQTERKNPQAVRLAAVDKQGQPLSFCSERQEAFLSWLAQGATLIPVTGRSVDAFRRVLLPLGKQAICSFGGVILDANGDPEAAWHQKMATAAEATAHLLAELDGIVAESAAQHSVDVRHRVIWDMGLPLYLSVKHNRGSEGEMGRLAAAVSPLTPPGWTLHRNGNNMALLPPFLGKAAAVAFFLERFIKDESVLTIGVGDSLTDVDFMRLCDYALAPTKSQIISALPQQALHTEREKQWT